MRSRALSVLLSIVERARETVGQLEEQAAEGVAEREEDEDHDRHHDGDEAHHLKELGAGLLVHGALPSRWWVITPRAG